MRVPSFDTVSPCAASIPLISPTTLLVAGSMMWRVSPAKLLWMIRNCAAIEEEDAVDSAIPANAARAPRITCLLDIFIILLFDDSLADFSRCLTPTSPLWGGRNAQHFGWG